MGAPDRRIARWAPGMIGNFTSPLAQTMNFCTRRHYEDSDAHARRVKSFLHVEFGPRGSPINMT
jgi:hypothetical protein